MSEDTLTDIRWGGALIDAVSLTGSTSRAFIAHMPARGRGGALSDRGPELREWRVGVKWTSRGRYDDPRARWNALRELDDGRTRLLERPGERALPTKMSIEEYNEESGRLNASLRFVEDRGDPRHVRAPGAGVTRQSAIEAVLGRARTAAAALARHGLPTDVATDSEALADSWRAPGHTMGRATSADVTTGVSRQSAAIRARVEDSAATREQSRLDVYWALIDLDAALADAAELITAGPAGLVELDVHEPITVLALAAKLYGAANARQSAADIARLNPLASVNAVPAHTLLTIPTVPYAR